MGCYSTLNVLSSVLRYLRLLEEMTTRAANRKDRSSLSNNEDIHSTHLSLSLSVDFKTQTLKGWAEHTMVVDKAGVGVAVFDTSSGLKVESAEVDGRSCQLILSDTLSTGLHQV